VNLFVYLVAAFVAIGILTIALVIGLAWLSMRLQRLEERLTDGPSHKDLAAIRDRLSEMSGHMSALASQQQVSTQAIQTIQHHLMESDS
jgi:hypothetical protein